MSCKQQSHTMQLRVTHPDGSSQIVLAGPIAGTADRTSSMDGGYGEAVLGFTADGWQVTRLQRLADHPMPPVADSVG